MRCIKVRSPRRSSPRSRLCDHLVAEAVHLLKFPLGVDKLTHLIQLKAESIHIIREVAAEFDNPVMLYSNGGNGLRAAAVRPDKPQSVKRRSQDRACHTAHSLPAAHPSWKRRSRRVLPTLRPDSRNDGKRRAYRSSHGGVAARIGRPSLCRFPSWRIAFPGSPYYCIRAIMADFGTFNDVAIFDADSLKQIGSIKMPGGDMAITTAQVFIR